MKWKLLIVVVVTALLLVGVYKIGYYEGWSDGSQFVIDEIKKKIDENQNRHRIPRPEKNSHVIETKLEKS